MLFFIGNLVYFQLSVVYLRDILTLGFLGKLEKWHMQSICWRVNIATIYSWTSYFSGATNQTFLHIDHAQSMLVRLQFRYPSLIKLLSTQPSCLNVQLTSVVHLCGLYLRVVQKIRKSKSFVDKYFSSGRRAIRFVSGLKQRFISSSSRI